MTEEAKQVITLKVDAKGVPLELEVNGEPLVISPDQLEQGDELLGVFAKAAGMVLALRSQPATRGRGCHLINGKWICT